MTSATSFQNKGQEETMHHAGMQPLESLIVHCLPFENAVA